MANTDFEPGGSGGGGATAAECGGNDDRVPETVAVEKATKHNNLGEEAEIPESCDDDDDDEGTSEASAVVDRLPCDMPPDECDLDDDDDALGSTEEEEEENEQLQHLRDMIGRQFSEDGSDSEDDDEDGTRRKRKAEENPERGSGNSPISWTWQQSASQRRLAAALFLRVMCEAASKLAAQAEAYVREAHRAKAEAAAQAFKRARLIGATVVGATRRLQALRASEPFAMIVEEACEVLEPTLMSVLSVRSLKKLELVGDHRQLPAFVQQCWFAVETTHPSIKVSLFERLVTSSQQASSALCTVLDEQRRMRPAIADLTRSEYEDLIQIRQQQVVIRDHDCTRSQRVADRLVASGAKSVERERELWEGRGDLVPGIVPQQFFWEIAESREGRAHVVSTKPGNRFVALKNRFIVAMSRARLGFVCLGSSEAVTKDKKGSSGPAHWRRLLGELGGDFKSSTSSPAEEEEEEQDVPRVGSSLRICCPRHRNVRLDVGRADDFPRLTAEGAQTTPFCTLRCSYRLPWCSHQCSKPCHSPALRPHADPKKCAEMVERPCELHADVPLRCGDVKRGALGEAASLADALRSYECDIPVEYRRPECTHVCRIPCRRQKRIVSGAEVLGPCEEIVEDFVHPECNHARRAPRCHERRSWELKAPQCRERVELGRDCGCRVEMDCYERVRESAAELPKPKCLEGRTIPRPRCSHRLSLRCHEANALKIAWSERGGNAALPGGGGGDAMICVEHGVPYGPEETKLFREVIDPTRLIARCKVKTQYRASCGHLIRDVDCFRAFECATGVQAEPKCVLPKAFASPICGHEIRAECWLEAECAHLPSSPWILAGGAAEGVVVDDDDRDPERVANEQELELLQPLTPPHLSIARKLVNRCKRRVSIVRKCGHAVRDVPCSQLPTTLLSGTKQFPRCRTLVQIPRACGHVYEVECHRKGEALPPCVEPVSDEFTYPACGHAVRPGDCKRLAELRARVNPLCPIEVRCTRARCGHPIVVPCYLENNVTSVLPGARLDPTAARPVVDADVVYCDAAEGVPDCVSPVVFRQSCGHELVDIPCHSAFDWASNPDAAAAAFPACEVRVPVESPLCGHESSLPCHLLSAFKAWDPWNGGDPEMITLAFDEEDDAPVTMPVVRSDGLPADRPPEAIAKFLQCGPGRKTQIVRPCGHEARVPCTSIWTELENGRCDALETWTCPRCSNETKITCDELERQTAAAVVVVQCQARVSKPCTICGINTVKGEICCKEKIECNRDVVWTRPCGHEVRWCCGGEDDPRETGESCLVCVHGEWLEALESSKRLESQLQQQQQYRAAARNDKGEQLAAAAEGRAVPQQQQVSVSIEEELRSRVERLLPPSCVVENMVVASREIKYAGVVRGYQKILNGYCDLLAKAVENEDTMNLLVCSPPHPNNADSYDIVFRRVQSDRTSFDSRGLADTPFGSGIRATLLTAEEIAACPRADDGTTSVAVAAALRHRPLENTPAFINMNNKNNRKHKKKVNKMKQERITAGFDYVVPPKKPNARIYWIPDTVVPLCTLRLRQHVDCGVCLDKFKQSDGCRCARGEHFTCWPCLYEHAKVALQGNALKRTLIEGDLCCPGDGCDASYDLQNVALQANAAGEANREACRAAFSAIHSLKLKAHEDRVLPKALEDQKRQMEADFDRIMQIQDGTERRAALLHHRICEQILTLRCPKCKAAFGDFDGCFALTCAAQHCQVQFCAWCLNHWDARDCHNHVATCPEASRRGYFHSFEIFTQHHNNRRQRRVIERLQREEPDVRRAALRLLRKDFGDLNITIPPDMARM
ncbi:hypothetical protein CTAYLR_003526 [Chrysophaeum taylorii]|uniref:RING-type domain-containing protein n=1 Tax=Chrysophaeum taylorii TaxID=2483200 RepID=A0AAD7XND6_9STRA|nr:hypothetical protein CTAYLR_003526 [Chrysophaeum taylorii]